MYVKFDHNILLLLQIGFIICFANATSKTNVIYWTLINYKLVIRIILTIKLYIIAYRFDIKKQY